MSRLISTQPSSPPPSPLLTYTSLNETHHTNPVKNSHPSWFTFHTRLVSGRIPGNISKDVFNLWFDNWV